MPILVPDGSKYGEVARELCTTSVPNSQPPKGPGIHRCNGDGNLVMPQWFSIFAVVESDRAYTKQARLYLRLRCTPIGSEGPTYPSPCRPRIIKQLTAFRKDHFTPFFSLSVSLFPGPTPIIQSTSSLNGSRLLIQLARAWGGGQLPASVVAVWLL